jgi:hypothetical protein
MKCNKLRHKKGSRKSRHFQQNNAALVTSRFFAVEIYQTRYDIIITFKVLEAIFKSAQPGSEVEL